MSMLIGNFDFIEIFWDFEHSVGILIRSVWILIGRRSDFDCMDFDTTLTLSWEWVSSVQSRGGKMTTRHLGVQCKSSL